MTTPLVRWPPAARSPLRVLATVAPWRACGYLVSYLVLGSAMFAVTAAAVLGSVVVGQLTLGLPLVVGAAWTVRGCAQLERGRALLVDRPIPHRYPEVAGSGLAAQIRARWTSPVPLRDCAYLLLLFPPLLALDAAALAAWLAPFVGISLPLWYWTVDPKVLGIRVDSPLTALLFLAAGVALSGFAARLLMLAAALHLAVARSVLGPPRDPLAEVRRMLREPGPLTDWATGAPARGRSSEWDFALGFELDEGENA
ncbi:sensor domain-containing protein [Streptacidiphilus sp. P02-A3a]|uniref:sensor domain-containing protein n=1 Tax=Streptacidiphilus sp. P02-A3a TaxID=2704468 RepID=UPI0015F883ED|nr:sensor domain-containing protein [Streptacidiphilus sp. P02-A3a]QMU72546.1 hypothetical protein GXP74_34165 [Streptacidiphilus sp. P02-A3a]